MLQLSHLPRLAPLHCEHANGHFSTFSTTKAARRGSAPLKGGGCHLLLAPPWRDGVPLSLPYLLELLESFWSTFSSEAHCNLRRPPTYMWSVDLNVVTWWMTAVFFYSLFLLFLLRIHRKLILNNFKTLKYISRKRNLVFNSVHEITM